MARIKNARRTILDLGEDLLQDRGFNGFSYAHIARELGVKNAAIHYHFPAKEDLAIGVIRRYRDRFKLWTGNSRVKDLDPTGKLDWFLSIYTDYRADNGKVCLIGSLEAEYMVIPENLQAEIAVLHEEMLTWLTDLLQSGRDSGAFRFGGKPETRAAILLSSVQGALQMARALGTRSFRALVKQLKRDLVI